jgi:hypothetical protein
MKQKIKNTVRTRIQGTVSNMVKKCYVLVRFSARCGKRAYYITGCLSQKSSSKMVFHFDRPSRPSENVKAAYKQLGGRFAFPQDVGLLPFCQLRFVPHVNPLQAPSLRIVGLLSATWIWRVRGSTLILSSRSSAVASFRLDWMHHRFCSIRRSYMR